MFLSWCLCTSVRAPACWSLLPGRKTATVYPHTPTEPLTPGWSRSRTAPASGASWRPTTPQAHHARAPCIGALSPAGGPSRHRQRQEIKETNPQKLGRERDLPFAATPRLAEPLLTKNELGTNSSSESESGVGWATPLPSNRLWLSLAGGEGGGEGDCSIGVEEADEQCKGAPANHKDKHRQKKK